MKSLIVDDDDISRDVLKRILDKYGECHTADTGEEAVDAFQKAWSKGLPYELISMDIVMPGLDGILAVEKIREIESDKEIPQERRVKIIMATSKSDSDNVRLSLEKGCNQFIVKPVKKRVFKEKLKLLGFSIL